VPKRPRGQRAEHKTIAAERIERLFELADRVPTNKLELAHRYIQLAWRLATRYNIRLPPRLKGKFCRKCLTFLKPGVSCRVRTRPKPPRVVITCLRCGGQMRLPYKQSRAAKWRGENVGAVNSAKMKG
jgi:ribonuclease P protein subunit RPR2